MAPTRPLSRRFGVPATLLLAGVLALGACQSAEPSASAVGVTPAVVTAPPQVSADVLAQRGQIVTRGEVEPVLGDDDVVVGQSRRAVYRSASGVDGAAREVSGLFAVPSGDPPPGGWPIVSMAHGTTGIGNDCGPSASPDLMGFLDGVRALLGSGHAVAFSDYEGLGTAGRHPYLEPRTAAFNVTDAVRALRQLFGGTSTRWLAFGNSQGGQAAWAADEQADLYGDGLELVGAVALSPAANITPLAELAHQGALTKEQQALMPLVVGGLARYDARLAPDTILADAVTEHETVMFGCGADAAAARSRYTSEDTVRPVDEAAVAEFRDALARIALPQRPLAAPLLVVDGLDDPVVFPQWTAAAVRAACATGGVVSLYEIPGAGHDDLGAEANDTVSAWITDRFDGVAAPSNCSEGR